jgi:hypothetical protein
MWDRWNWSRRGLADSTKLGGKALWTKGFPVASSPLCGIELARSVRYTGTGLQPSAGALPPRLSSKLRKETAVQRQTR